MDTVLIIDDDAMVRALLDGYLSEMGFGVITAANGRLGVDAAKKALPDLIVLDLMMPQMDGFEACSLLKEDFATSDIPVIFLTCINDNESIVKCFNSGCVDYLMKPFECVELLARIKTHIAMKKQKQEIVEINLRMEKELEMARAFQRSLIPASFPQSVPLKWAARFVPAFHLAGDYYDFIDMGRGRAGLVMADVCGHGVCAAMIAAMLKMDFLLISDFDDPGEILCKINRHLCGSLREGDFVTAFFGIYDSSSRVLSYSLAGHPPPFLYKKAEDEIFILPENGLPLGCFEDSPYDTLNLPLEPGDRIMLYTDGVYEVKDEEGRLYSEERLFEKFRLTGVLPVEEAERAVYDDVMGFSGSRRLPDDYTLILLEF